MVQNLVEEIRERAIKSFMDLFVLETLKSNELSGYDFINLIHNRFDVLVSSGTVYSLLYSLERKGFIEGRYVDRKRVYSLTDLGRQGIEKVEKANGAIRIVLKDLKVL